MKKILSMLSIILAFNVFCINHLMAADSAKVQITGTIVNNQYPAKTYTVQAVSVGAHQTVLEECRPEENGLFQLVVYTDKSFRVIIKDKKGNIIMKRVLAATDGVNRFEFNQIDASPKKDKE